MNWRRVRRGGFLAAVGVAVAAALPIFAWPPSLIQLPVSDALLQLAEKAPPLPPEGYPDVAIVMIDKQSLLEVQDARKLEQMWPWPRNLHGEVVKALEAHGARAIAFDIDFSTRLDRPGDLAFARVIKESGRVVLPAYREFDQLGELGVVEIATVPAPEFSLGAAAVGHVVLDLDRDGVIRRGARGRSIAAQEFPSLVEASIAVALGEPAAKRESGGFLIDYRRVRPRIPTIPIASVLDDSFDPEMVRGRIVLVGATAVEFQDLWPTPIEPSLPGVYIQALSVRTLLAEHAGESALAVASPASQFGLAVLLSFLAAAVGRGPNRRRLAGLGALGVGVLAGVLALVVHRGLLLDPIVPLMVLSTHYALGLETLRHIIGRRLADREHSLTTLFQLSKAASGVENQSSLDLALSLLGDVVHANGVALFRTAGAGSLDPKRLEWQRGEGGRVGDLRTACQILDDGSMRVFEGNIPGHEKRPGSAVYVPLSARDTAVGVLVVERESCEPLDPMQLRTIAAVGAQLALTIENLQLLERAKTTMAASVEAIASAVEARDGYTDMHCRRLAVFCTTMAERMDLPHEEVEAIQLGALLHDVGKIGISDQLLLKPGRLTPEERKKIEEHPVIGQRIVAPIQEFSDVTIACIRHHHECWDGSGYPDRLAGEDIPLCARIVCVVDVWDALSSERPYKPALPQDKVREIMLKESGTRFDPLLVSLFFRILDEEGPQMLALVQRFSTREEKPA